MPQQGDPYGARAFSQQIGKELMAANNFRKAKKDQEKILKDGSPFDDASSIASGAMMVTNPITHVERPVHYKTSAATTAMAMALDQQRQALSMMGGKGDKNAAGPGGPTGPLTTEQNMQLLRRHREQDFESRIGRLERALNQEREGRLAVQSELAQLQELLEQNLE